MSHEAGKTEQRDSITATNGHSSPPSSNDGSAIASPGVDGARAQSPVDINLASEGYDMGPATQPGGDPSPRNPNYAPNPTPAAEKESQPRSKGQTPPLEPPVTEATLGELDVDKITNSPKLRHDINFDPALHFRPNLDGEKGRRKRQKANDFWETMHKQLRDYMANREQFEKEMGDEDWCLPVTLKAIRGILETLVPERDRAPMEETFNVDLLMQQFRKGVADLVKLAVWLSQLLKCHCAPMRDPWVDDMVTQISRGDRDGDVSLLVRGIHNLLGILEAMKLVSSGPWLCFYLLHLQVHNCPSVLIHIQDVANHQIRCLRPLLIEDTVQFEQKFFMKKIASGRVDLAAAHAWFKQAHSLPAMATLEPTTPSQANTWHFMKALVNLTLPSKFEEMVPHTFLFDEERLIKLRADIEDATNLEICMHLFHGLELAGRMQVGRAMPYDDTPLTSFVPSPFDRPATPANNAMQLSPKLPLAHHFVPKARSNLIQDDGDPIQSPPDSQEWVPALDNDTIALSAAASPHSSPSSTASTPNTYSPTPLYLSNPTPDSASQVRSSLLAILDSSISSNRWTALAPSLALEILRSTTTPLSLLPHFESHLELHLSNPCSRIYQDAEQRVLLQLLPILQKLIETYTPLTCLQIFETATAQKVAPNSSAYPDNSKSEITEIATRIAHIGILHWRVWAPLAYLVDPDGAGTEAVDEEDGSVP
jgi:hypothetical protein